ncbi:hypothetical protein Naga_100052g40, partial [Nannochloropsis gaditana]
FLPFPPASRACVPPFPPCHRPPLTSAPPTLEARPARDPLPARLRPARHAPPPRPRTRARALGQRGGDARLDRGAGARLPGHGLREAGERGSPGGGGGRGGSGLAEHPAGPRLHPGRGLSGPGAPFCLHGRQRGGSERAWRSPPLPPHAGDLSGREGRAGGRARPGGPRPAAGEARPRDVPGDSGRGPGPGYGGLGRPGLL